MRLLILMVLAMTTLSLPSTPAEAATPRCQGAPATIVGKPGDPTLKGTRRRDVVVTNGASHVDTFGGDDLVCVTRGGQTWVATYGGDDSVVVSARSDGVFAQLGGGADQFVGGPGHDTVIVKDGGDDIATGAGRDGVTLSAVGAPSRVSLGPGNDAFGVGRGPSDGAFAEVDGGDGRDHLDVRSAGSLDIAVDNVAGTFTLGEEKRLHWTSVESFGLGGATAPHVTFQGSSADERVKLQDDNPGRVGTFSILTGGGDDSVRAPAVIDGEVDAGDGTDTIRLASDVWEGIDSFAADLVTGEVAVTVAGMSYEWTLAGMEDLETRNVYGIGFQVVSLRGTDGRNRIVTRACSPSVVGLAGNDTLKSKGGSCREDRRTVATIDGGDGDDVLVGSYGPDTLDGGPGTDVADGRQGRDTCYTETVTNCELP